MQDLFEFVIRHWGLCLLFVMILGLLLWQEFRTHVGGVRKLTPAQLIDLLNHQEAAVVDIRDNAAFANAHILNSINTPFKDFENNQVPKKLQKYKTKFVILVCSAGQQALKLGLKLRQQGFTEVHVLQGGLTAWRNANLPLTKK